MLDNISKFHKHTFLKQAVLTFIASQLLNKKETQQLTQVFQSLDKKGNGRLSKAELKQAFQDNSKRDISDHDLDRIFTSIDASNTGYIEFTEFLVASTNERTLLSQTRLDAAFKMFDLDNNNVISKKEMRRIFTTTESLNTIFK